MCTQPQKSWQAVDASTGISLGHPLIFPHRKQQLEKADNWDDLDYEEIAISCQKCTECLASKSQNWSIRNFCELHQSPSGNYFITLTYDNEHYPKNGSLELDHITKFLKRLRNHLGSFRYYYVGEYGETTKRAHWHLCLYGLDLDETQYEVSPASKDGHTYYRHPKITSIWGKGNVEIGELNMSTINYVCKYINKAVYGEQKKERYKRISEKGNVFYVKPEFGHMSKRPPLGSAFFEKYQSDYDHPDTDFFVLPKGIKTLVPKAFLRILESQPGTESIEIKKARKEKHIPRTSAELARQERYNKIILAQTKRDKI